MQRLKPRPTRNPKSEIHNPRSQMEHPMQATLTLISPHGRPVTLTIEPDADTEVITALLDRADAIGRHYVVHGWVLAELDSEHFQPERGSQ